MAKPHVNYWVDVGIGAAFVVSAVSGLVFLLPVGGDVGATGVLGVAYRTWDRVHLWASLAMIAGVVAHLVLHSKWIVCMTQRTFRRTRSGPVAVPAPTSLPRRRFLLAGGATLAAGAVLATCGAAAAVLARVRERNADGEAVPDPKDERRVKPELAESTASDLPPVGGVEAPTHVATPDVPAEVPDEAEVPITVTPSEAMPVPTATAEVAAELCVTCPRGLVNDPYPGRCRLYVDRDGDGICDRSVPQPCG